jgi:phosphoserine aminotransferase
MQGGASAQFAAIPLNLAGPESSVDYLLTGAWSKKASAEARRYCRVNIAADEAASGYCTVPEARALKLSALGAAYVHYTPNETIGGVEFPYIPDVGRGAARGRHVLDPPVAALRRRALWAHLRRCAERISAPPASPW